MSCCRLSHIWTQLDLTRLGSNHKILNRRVKILTLHLLNDEKTQTSYLCMYKLTFASYFDTHQIVSPSATDLVRVELEFSVSPVSVFSRLLCLTWSTDGYTIHPKLWRAATHNWFLACILPPFCLEVAKLQVYATTA